MSNIESTSCNHCEAQPCSHRSHCRHRNVVRYRINILLTSPTLITLFTSFNLLTLQYSTISIQQFVIVLYLKPCLHRSHRRHRNVVRYRSNICIVSTLLTSNNLAYITYIVDIAVLYDIKSTSCRHRSTSSTSQCRINIVSTTFT